MKLWKHQQEIIDRNPEKELLPHSTGTGKTLTLCSLANKNKGKWLIICPKALTGQWEDKIKEYKFNFEHVILSKENFKKQSEKLPKMNVIIDEAHNVSGMQGIKKKSGLLKAVLSYIKKHNPERIYLATATPYMSTPWNIFALSEILGKGWDYKKFKAMFFQDVNMGMRWPIPVIRKQIDWNSGIIPVEKAIELCVKKLGTPIKLQDCFDVPEQTFITEYFDLTDSQKEAIDNLDELLPISRWTKIHQICGGSLKSDGYSKTMRFKCQKLDKLEELLIEHPKLIIVSRYREEAEMIGEFIKDRPVTHINGSVKDRNSEVKKAEELDKCVVIIQSACCEGYQLPSFPVMVFYSYDFSLKNYQQMIGRILRGDKLKKNLYISLIIKKTIDQEIKNCIDNKCDFDIAIYGKSL